MDIESRKKLLKVDELARFLNVSRQTVYRLIEKRRIPFIKISGAIRFDEDEVRKFLNNNRVDSMPT